MLNVRQLLAETRGPIGHVLISPQYEEQLSNTAFHKDMSHVRHLQNFRAFLFIRDQRKEKSGKNNQGSKAKGKKVKMEPSKVHELDLHAKKLSIIEGVDKVRPLLFYFVCNWYP